VFLFDKIVRISNRGQYTSGKRAASYCGRALAIQISRSEIQMLEAAELMLIRQERRHSRSQRTPEDLTQVHWYVGESGGSPFVRDLSGFAAGIRLWQGETGKPEHAGLSQIGGSASPICGK